MQFLEYKSADCFVLYVSLSSEYVIGPNIKSHHIWANDYQNFNNKYGAYCQMDIFSKWFVMLGFWASEMDSYLSSSG
jgi:hypothetical protein